MADENGKGVWDLEAEEATLEQLKRTYDIGVSEALQGTLEGQNRADEAQIEEMRTLLQSWREGASDKTLFEGSDKSEASAQLISSMQPIYSRINKRKKLMRVLRDLQKIFTKQFKSGEMDKVGMEVLRNMRNNSTAVAARKRKANESKQPGGGSAKKRRTEEANPAGAMKLERGKHLKEKPHMPQTARAGQKRWKDLLEKMRDEAKASTPNKEFSKQLAECKRLKLKSQKEALLLFLHATSRDGLIRAGKFCDARDTERGFIGWTSFTIEQATATSFYRQVQDLFGQDSDPKTNTIHSIFRRAGLVPQEWNKGWDGHVPFVYNLKSSAAEA